MSKVAKFSARQFYVYSISTVNYTSTTMNCNELHEQIINVMIPVLHDAGNVYCIPTLIVININVLLKKVINIKVLIETEQ